MAVITSDNTQLLELTLPTSAENLHTAVGAVAAPKQVVLEESTVASWAYRTLLPCAQQVVVCDPVKNRWIYADEKINDVNAALKLAKLLRAGYITPVHHSPAPQQIFKELVQAYHDKTRELVRCKNKLKAKFRQHGVHCSDSTVYSSRGQEQWLRRLQDSAVCLQAQMLLDSIDHFQQQKDKLRREIARRAKVFKPIHAFQQVPGVGLIRAVTLFAIIDTPYRFANKRKLWSYCGLGIARGVSDQMVGPQHLTRRGNRLLKQTAKSAALAAIARNDNRFAQQYETLLAHGVKPENARLTVARAIISTLWGMWRKDQSYQPDEPGPQSFNSQTKE